MLIKSLLCFFSLIFLCYTLTCQEDTLPEAVPDGEIAQCGNIKQLVLTYWSNLEEMLYHAAATGNLIAVRLLLLKVFMPIETCGAEKTTLLHAATSGGHLATVALLIELDADLHATDDRGYTPLHHAIINKHDEVAQLLVSHGADINSPCPLISASLILALESRSLGIIPFLLQQGAFVDPQSPLRALPLAWQLENGIPQAINVIGSIHGIPEVIKSVILSFLSRAWFTPSDKKTHSGLI